MDRLISCKFNMDTACVELKFFDGSMIAIDTIAVENEVADNMYQRSELDYLIYNDPIERRFQNLFEKLLQSINLWIRRLERFAWLTKPLSP